MLSELFSLEKIMGVCEKICFFLVVNFLFILCNIPVLLFLLFVGPEQIRTCLPLFLCSMIPMAPALSAVFYSMGRMIRGTQSKAVKDFIHGYTSDIIQKLKLAAIQAFAVLVAFTNIEFFSRQVIIKPLVILFGLLFVFFIILTPNLYLLASRYEMKTRDIIRTAAILTIVKPVNTVGTVAALALVLMALEISAGTTVLFMASVYGFLVVFMSQRILNELEKN